MGGFKFEPKGWQKLKAMLNPTEFTGTLDKNLKKATAYNAKLVRRKVREVMKANEFSPNAQLTIAIKHSSKSLIDNADLFNAVSDVVVDAKTAFVGVLRRVRGGQMANLAAILHEGAMIPVTENMRILFFSLYQAYHGKISPSKLEGRAAELWEESKGEVRFLPLAKGTTHIVIPPRDYFERAFEDKQLLAELKGNWQAAVKGTFDHLGKK
jgi:hypothetical protein